jgi:hypothetical protein
MVGIIALVTIYCVICALFLLGIGIQAEREGVKNQTVRGVPRETNRRLK